MMSIRIYFGSTVRLLSLPASNYSSCSNLSTRLRNSLPSHSNLKERAAVFTCQRHASSVTDKDLGKEVYHGPLASRIRSVKLFSLSTSLLGLMAQPIVFQKILEQGTSIALVIFSGVIIQFFTFVTPVLLHIVTKRYVRVIYFNPETEMYSALTYNIWAGDKLLSFKPDDVVVPDIPAMLTSFNIKGTPLFIEPNFFNDLNHYKRIMGLDKSLDFKLDEKSTKP